MDQERETQTPPAPTEMENRFVKYSIKPAVPEYDAAQYAANLADDDWSKEETDYLIDLARDLELRWVAIWDRYDYQPGEAQDTGGGADVMVVAPAARQRSMEDLKYRYYQVAAKMMAITTPLASMTVPEFELYEKMLKFDPNRETTRKKLAAALMARSPEEIREEEILMGELKRIVDHEERFLEERKELYARLDFPPSTGSIAQYETSAGLQGLAMQIANADRSRNKRRSLADANSAASGAPHSARQEPPPSARVSGADPRPSLAGKTKKGAAAAAAQRRELSARDEAKFGVRHHERLTSGVSFRQARVEKLVLAKSAAQAQKLHDALAELSVPVKAVMPTNRVCGEYERLITGIHALLDARKTAEKMNNEIKVLKAQKESRERRERGEEEPPEEEEAEAEDSNEQNEDDDEKEDDRQVRRRDDEDEDADDKADVDADDDEDPDDANNESWPVGRIDEQNDEDEEGDGDGDGDMQEESDEGEGNEEADEEDEEDAGAEAEVDGSDEEGEEEKEDGDEEVEDEEGEGEDDDDDEQADIQNSDEGVDGDEDGEPEPEPSMAHKRSASVLSLASQHSNKRTRR